MLDAVVMAGRPEEIDAPPSWLTPAERERAARLRHEADRAAFVAAHLLVRLAAAACLDADPARLGLTQHCDLHGPGHGRPSLEGHPELGVSFSHTRGYVAAVAGPGKVGVDVERIPDGPLDPALAASVTAPGERVADSRELIRLWARKEALIKRGELSLDRMRTTAWRPGPHVLEWECDGVLGTAVTDRPARRIP
ncbi:4'-phosphopantetheinyl transferase family protein [Nonomuraea sp. NPDC050328]|uniref:4'-phosphopantetheinyl transferase family protein n=1 Tax=Nonomuraea sp. NPDC050328 TaxID=3364361 RepID=UPI00379AE077